MAPTLFNIYYNAMVARRRVYFEVAGVNVLCRHRRRLVGDHTVKSGLDRVQVTEFQFADDLVMYAAFQTEFESVGQSFVVEASHFGLTVGLTKTKG